MKKIYAELSKIQQGLKAPKNLYNNFGKYSYRNAEGILEAVKPLLNGLALVINDEPVLIGNRFYIKAVATLTDGEESVSATAYAREDETKKGMDGCQITGACSSYARKYALNALLMIDDAKDSDDDSLSPKNPKNMEHKEDVNPPQKDVGGVSKGSTIPGETPDLANNYIMNEIAYIQEKLGLREYKEAKDQFVRWGNALVEGGALKPFDWMNMTLQQAKNLCGAIRITYMAGDEK